MNKELINSKFISMRFFKYKINQYKIVNNWITFKKILVKT